MIATHLDGIKRDWTLLDDPDCNKVLHFERGRTDNADVGRSISFSLCLDRSKGLRKPTDSYDAKPPPVANQAPKPKA